MIKLSGAISKVIVDYYGEHEFLRRLSDPLWFQAFGCVLGFDWHSSGVTTVVTGVLKQALTVENHGISIVGGKGKKSREAKTDIPRLAEKNYNLSSAKTNSLLYASKMGQRLTVWQYRMVTRYIIMWSCSIKMAIGQLDNKG